MKSAPKLFIILILLLFFFSHVRDVSAYEMFGIDSPEIASNVYDGKPENIKNWPKAVVEAMKTMQWEIMMAAKDKRNWRVDREVHGRIDEYYLDEQRPPSNVLVSFGRLVKRAVNTVGEFLGIKKQTLFTGDGWVYGPQDCDYPTDKDSSVRINLDRLDLQGFMVDPKNSNRRIEYEFVAKFSISFWDCEDKSTSQLDIPPTTVNWSQIALIDKNAVSKLFANIVKQQITADYSIAYGLTGDEKLEEMDRTITTEGKTQKTPDEAKKTQSTGRPPIVERIDNTQLHGSYEETPHRYLLKVTASDPEGGKLTFVWKINCGYFVGPVDGSQVEWRYDTPGECPDAIVVVGAKDNEGLSTEKSQRVFN